MLLRSHFKDVVLGVRSKHMCPFRRTGSEHLCWGRGVVTNPMMGHLTPTSGVLDNV